MATQLFAHIQAGNTAGVRRACITLPSATTVKDSKDRTPLHLACSLGHAAICAELLQHSAPLDAVDRSGNTPIHIAAEHGYADVLAKLLATPAKLTLLKLKNKLGETPLHLAAKGGHAQSIQKLMEAGARPDIKDKANNTPVDLLPPDKAEVCAPLLSGGMVPAAAPTPIRVSSQGVQSDVGATPSPVHRTSASQLPRPLSGRKPPSAAEGATARAAGEAAVSSLQATVSVLQSELATTRELASQGSEAAKATTAMSEELQVAIKLVHTQARRIEDLEARLALQEERSKDYRNRVGRLEDELKEVKSTEGQHREMQDHAHRNLQSTIQRITSDQHHSQAVLQELSSSLAALGARTGLLASTSSFSAAVPPATPGRVGSADATFPHDELAVVKARVHELVQELAAQDLPAQVQKLSLNLQQLSAKCVVQAELDVLRQRVNAMQEMSLGDKFQLLELRVQQLAGPVAHLTQQSADQAERIAGLVGMRGHADASSHSTAPQEGNGQAVQAAAHAAQVKSLQDEVTVLKEQVTSLRTALTSFRTPPASPIAPGARSPSTADTYHAPDTGHLHAQLTELKSALNDVKVEWRTDNGSMRREWQKAVAELQQRYIEQRSELSEREGRLKAMREMALQDEEVRLERDKFESKVNEKLRTLETSLGYLQHKYEVLEEELQNVAANMASGGAASPRSPIYSPRGAQSTGPSRMSSRAGPVAEQDGSYPAALSLAAAVGSALAASSLGTSPRSPRVTLGMPPFMVHVPGSGMAGGHVLSPLRPHRAPAADSFSATAGDYDRAGTATLCVALAGPGGPQYPTRESQQAGHRHECSPCEGPGHQPSIASGAMQRPQADAAAAGWQSSTASAVQQQLPADSDGCRRTELMQRLLELERLAAQQQAGPTGTGTQPQCAPEETGEQRPLRKQEPQLKVGNEGAQSAVQGQVKKGANARKKGECVLS